jgi:hypothetical protein
MADSVTSDRVRGILKYDPATGVFLWQKHFHLAKVGTTAGFSDNRSGIVYIGIDGRQYQAARIAWLYMTGDWPSGLINFKDGNNKNLIWENLRDASQSEKSAASRIHSNNKSGYRGVSFDKQSQKWRAQIRVKGKNSTLGFFETAEEASSAYMQAARSSFGEYAKG